MLPTQILVPSQHQSFALATTAFGLGTTYVEKLLAE
jgi:hypothetical protein